MKLVPITQVFHVSYGQKIDSNKTTEHDEGVNFVTRSRRNLGISGKVALIPGIEPSEAGNISVTLGGTYLLSAFVQPEKFYTAQNIKVLEPIDTMTFNEKVFYCECITANRFRYSSHGREANRSFDEMLVPSRADVPQWVFKKYDFRTPLASTVKGWNTAPSAPPGSNELVPLISLFELKNGTNVPVDALAEDDEADTVPLIRPSKRQISSYVRHVDPSVISSQHRYPAGTLYVSTNGQGSHSYAYVAATDFIPNTDVTVLLDRSGKMTLLEKIYYAAAISENRRLFSYGRKPKGRRLENILVPKTPPAFVYATNYLKGLTQSNAQK